MLMQKNIPIVLSDVPNRHMLIWGKSGFGKSYFGIRKIEEDYGLKRKITVIDYSSSYTESELIRANFKYMDSVLMLNPSQNPIYWECNSKNINYFLHESKDILVKAMNINSYNQSTLIFQALIYLHKNNESPCFSWSIPELIGALTDLKKFLVPDKDNLDMPQNIERLLTRLVKYESIRNFHVVFKPLNCKQRRNIVTIFQLSDLPDEQRRFLTAIISELLWLETKRGKSSLNYYDTIIFDEFQFLPINCGSALSCFLREGRKFGVGVVLATQFISKKNADEMHTLLQSANLLIFHPDEHDVTFTAKVIDSVNFRLWIPLLKSLEIGQAILMGNYLINNTLLLHAPIVCNITTNGGNTNV